MNLVAILLAGGQGSRLSILSQRRAKPAVPFGGAYRIIDFTVSNAMHAQIPALGIATQYKPSSLMEHFGTGEWWGYMGRGRVARILPPYTGEADSDWYKGTADAVWQNRQFIQRFHPDIVVVLSGDHIYYMDYLQMVDFHVKSRADATVALQEVPWEETSRFGLVQIAENGRVTAFQEKPKSNPVSNLASLGIYIFNADILLRRLAEDAADPTSDNDFGKNILPAMQAQDRLFGWVFDGYWRDVGTIESYWQANMETLDPSSGLDLARWDVRTNYFDPRPGNDLPARICRGGRVRHSHIARGCVIEGEVENSIVFPGVHIGRNSVVRDSVIMNNCEIADDCLVDRAILDKDCVVDRSSRVGAGDNTVNKEFPHLLDSGITVLGKNVLLPPGTVLGRNALVFPGVRPEDLPGSEIESGATVRAAKPLW
ncbi:MAG: sugar phosphate nucleotidyltransferase [Candidatus Sumerlaeaceae bacterium]|nr:sugar phosphate nucleotidyltransferase [Candidatus Sumerlaeaceae bacterium]